LNSSNQKIKSLEPHSLPLNTISVLQNPEEQGLFTLGILISLIVSNSSSLETIKYKVSVICNGLSSYLPDGSDDNS